MRSNTRKLRKSLVKAIVLGCVLSIGLALAEPGGSPRPGGGYAEPVVLHPTPLDGDFSGGGGGGFPMHLSTF